MHVGSRVAGAVLSVIASIVSLYWISVGFENILFGFSWMLLAIFGTFAFALIAVCFPLIENTAVAKYSFDVNELATPWIIIALAIVVSTIGGVLIGRSDEEFPKHVLLTCLSPPEQKP